MEQKTKQLLAQINDEHFSAHVLMCVELLGVEELTRDIERATRAASATLHEFRKEVSEALIVAMAFNLTRSAFAYDRTDMKLYERIFKMLLNERELFDCIVHLATLAEIVAPACKREAEAIEAELNKLRKLTVKKSPIDDSDPKH